jgi:hypothetical protein
VQADQEDAEDRVLVHRNLQNNVECPLINRHRP